MLGLLYYSFGSIKTTAQAIRVENAASIELLVEMAVVVGYLMLVG